MSVVKYARQTAFKKKNLSMKFAIVRTERMTYTRVTHIK